VLLVFCPTKKLEIISINSCSHKKNIYMSSRAVQNKYPCKHTEVRVSQDFEIVKFRNRCVVELKTRSDLDYGPGVVFR
jgi:hypothetical protein